MRHRCKTNGKQGTDKRLSNLKPRWRPGESGNYRGRPRKEQAFADIARSMLSAREINILLTLPTGRTKELKIKSSESMRHAIIAGLIREALAGNVQAAKELVDRTDGKTTDRLSLMDTTPTKIIFEEVRLSEQIKKRAQEYVVAVEALQDRAQLPAVVIETARVDSPLPPAKLPGT